MSSPLSVVCRAHFKLALLLILCVPSAHADESTQRLEDLLVREDWDTAQVLSEDQLASLEAGSDPTLYLEWLDLWVEAHSHGPRAGDELTRMRAEEAIALRSAESDPEAFRHAQIRWVRILVAAEETARAEVIIDEVIVASTGEGAELRVLALREKANLLNELGRQEEEHAAITEARELLASDPGADPLLRVSLESRWALVLHDKWELDEARATIEPVLPIYDQLTPGDHPKRLRAWRRYANILVDSGEVDEAEPLLDWIYAAYVRLEGPRSNIVARVRNDQGILLRGVGDNWAARQAFVEAAEITEELRGPDDFSLLVLHQNIANMDVEMGDLQGALDEYREAQRIGYLRFPDGHYYISQMIGLEATVLTELGDFVAAEERLRTAIDLYKAQLGEEHHYVARAYNSLGNALIEQGRTEEAVECYRLYAAGMISRGGERGRGTYGAYRQLARGYSAMGQSDSALVTLDLCIEIAREFHPTSRGTLNGALQDRSRIYLSQGEFELAVLDGYESASRYREEYGEHAFTAGAFSGLARIQAAKGDWDAAITSMQLSTSMANRQLALVGRSSPEREALIFASNLRPIRDSAIQLAASRTGMLELVHTAWSAVGQSRALVLDELAKRRREAAVLSPELLAELETARRRLAQLYVQAVSADEDESHAERVREAEARREAAERAVARDAPRSEALAEFDLDTLIQALPADEALVAYTVYRSSDLIPRSGESVITRVAAFTLRDGRFGIQDLGTLEEIESLVTMWRSELIAGAQLMPGLEVSGVEEYRTVAGALSQRIWEPLAEWTQGARRVHIIPEGPLQQVDLYALPSSREGYLIDEGIEIIRWTTERDLMSSQPPTQRPAGRLLVVAGPSYDENPVESDEVILASGWRGAAPQCEDFAELQFSGLPHAQHEGEIVAAMWEKQGGRSQLLSGAAASEQRFKLDAPGASALHLATHAWFVDPSCDPLAGAGSQEVPHYPLLLSGMAFSGFNQRNAASAEDGVLTAEEIVALDLEAVEQVVLSGCDTGAGTSTVGQGILGLQRAFLLAGAHSVVMSLWPLDDAAARLWMESFYAARLQDGRSLSEAIRAAGLRAREVGGRPHPFYWSGFVAVKRN